jgi:ABC-type sulfate/molybdate transport systems ATPase subunit
VVRKLKLTEAQRLVHLAGDRHDPKVAAVRVVAGLETMTAGRFFVPD